VGIVAAPGVAATFLVGKDDEVYAFGDATSFGSLPPIPCVRDGVRPSGLSGFLLV